jgi:DNA repair protein RadC
MKDGFKEGQSKPHYYGHRERLRERFRACGSDAVADYELLELILFRALPRRDTKPIAKLLIDKFGSFAEVISAPPRRIMEVKGIGENVVTQIKLIHAAALKLTQGAILHKQVLASWSSVIDYCRASMAFNEKEQFRILFLDRKNMLIADEVQQEGLQSIFSTGGKLRYLVAPSTLFHHIRC